MHFEAISSRPLGNKPVNPFKPLILEGKNWFVGPVAFQRDAGGAPGELEDLDADGAPQRFGAANRRRRRAPDPGARGRKSCPRARARGVGAGAVPRADVLLYRLGLAKIRFSSNFLVRFLERKAKRSLFEEFRGLSRGLK